MDDYQQTIFDNGMSFAMAPQKSFISLIKTLYQKHGALCKAAHPLWACQISLENYAKLPKLTFNMLANKEGTTKTFELPRHAYMKLDPKHPGLGFLLFTPWNFQGLGGKEGEEYWVLGA